MSTRSIDHSSSFCRISVIASCMLAMPITAATTQDLQAQLTDPIVDTTVDVLAESDDVSADFIPDPYTVFVATAEAYARCGPDGEYYRTDKLKHGQPLDVYLETDDGWLGIRPPGKSFSWIQADDVQSDNESTGSVTEDGAVVWIGTHLGRARKYRWQVQLPAGEPVSILGRSEREGPDGPQLWYRIVPPSGEFRWVHRDQTVETPEELIESVRKAEQRSIAQAKSKRQSEQRKSTARRSNQPKADVRQVNNQQDVDLVPIRRAKSNELAERGGDPDNSPHQHASAAELRPVQRQPSLSSPGSEQSDPFVSRESNAKLVGSGVDPRWLPGSDQQKARAREIQSTASVPSAASFTQPRLLDLGASANQIAPGTGEIATDSNWVTGQSREPISQVSGLEPIKTHDLTGNANLSSFGNTPTPSSHGPSGRHISGSRIKAIANEVSGADVDQLQLVLARLMASAASEAEVAPVEDAARAIASQPDESLSSAKARLLVERVQQYRRIASRRDGQSIVQNQAPVRYATASLGTPTITPSGSSPVGNFPATGQATPVPPPPVGFTAQTASASLAPVGQGDASSQLDGQANSKSAVAPGTDPNTWVAGTLVEVYSARRHHPPFALTDSTGRTIAYVTPNPGLNIRGHLNSQVRVQGNQGYLPGINTPHILVTKAVRGVR